MRRRASRLAAAALAGATALAILWYWASPWWTLWRIREAAQAGDAAALAAYIDRDAVRAYARAQARASWDSLVRNGGRWDRDGRRQFLDSVRRNLAQIERTASNPAELRPWLAGLPVGSPRLGFTGEESGGNPRLVRDGLRGFELHYDSGDERSPLLTFRRKGLGWRLAGVRWGQQ